MRYLKLVEFIPREKTIILITSFMSNPAVKHVPKETLALGLSMMLKAKNIIMSVVTIQDYIDAIVNEQNESIKEGFGELDKMKGNLQ